MKTIFRQSFILMLLTLFAVQTSNAAVSFEYNSSKKTLVITGTGAMEDFVTVETAPWYQYKENIETVVVRQGVTHIGNSAFYEFTNLKYVSLPEGLISIGDYAFGYTAIQRLVLPQSLQTVGAAAFMYADNIKSIYMGGNLTQLGSTGNTDMDYAAFAFCDAVSDIYLYQSNVSSIAWNNTWEFKDGSATMIHVPEGASLPTGLNATFVNDIARDARQIGAGDLDDPNNPYEISSKWELDYICHLVNSGAMNTTTAGDGVYYLKLTADLEYDSTEKNNFTPLGTPSSTFAGVFDGNGHTISGINIQATSDHAGVFEYLSSSTVKNLTLENITINSTKSFVGVIGEASDATIEKVVVKNGNIKGYLYIGGLVGVSSNSTERNCLVENVSVEATATDETYSYAGGLVGRASSENVIEGCASNASVKGTKQYVGGLVGNNASSTIQDCIYYGNSVEGWTNPYGEKLYFAISDNGTITNCYYTESSIPVPTDKGILANSVTVGDGVAFTDAVTTDYGTADFPGIKVYADYIGLGNIYYVKPNTTLTFADNTVSYRVNGDYYEGGNTVDIAENTTIYVYDLMGGGTEDDPYIISTTREMELFRSSVANGNDYTGKYVLLTADLEYDISVENNYVPVGTYIAERTMMPFNGNFNGGGHTISGININKDGGDYVSGWDSQYKGVFGKIGSSAVVANLRVANSRFRSNQHLGGIVGYSDGGTIINCQVMDDVSLVGNQESAWYVGGICGYNKDGHIYGCVSYASVTATGNAWYYGGITGYDTGGNAQQNVKNCLYMGNTVQAASYVGAVAGTPWYSPSSPNPFLSYYTDSSMSDSRYQLAHNLYLDEGVEIDATKTEYGEGDYQWLTAWDNGVIYYDDGSGTGGKYYVAEGVDVALKYTGTPAEDEQFLTFYPIPYTYVIGDAATLPTMSGNTLTMGGCDAAVHAVFRRSLYADTIRDNWLIFRNNKYGEGQETENSLVIMNARELALFAYQVNIEGRTFEGYTVSLGADLEMQPVYSWYWEPIGSTVVPNRLFKGVFDGKGHKIQNLQTSYNDNTSTYNTKVGLFSELPEGAEVKNLVITRSDVSGNRSVGVVAGENRGKITNVHVIVSSITPKSDPSGTQNGSANIGGIAGINEGGEISNCSATNIDINSIFCDKNAAYGVICGLNSYASYYDADGQHLTVSTVKDNLSLGRIKVQTDDPWGYYGLVIGRNMDYTDYNDVVTPNVVNNNYYGSYNNYGNNAIEVTNPVPALYWEDPDTHPYDVSEGMGIGADVPSAYGFSYKSADIDGVAELAPKDDKDNTAFLTLLKNRDDYLGLTGIHHFTLNGRTLYKNGAWNTLCLPFDLSSLSDTPLADATMKQLSSVQTEDDVMTLNFTDANSIEAGVPYLVRWDTEGENLVNPKFTNLLVSADNPSVSESEGIDLKGVFAPMVFEEGSSDESILFMGANSTLYYPSGNERAYINAFRSYFQLKDGASGVKQFVLNFNGEDSATGIVDVDGQMQVLTDEWYDMSGRRINGKPTVPGIYINGGKKVVVK